MKFQELNLEPSLLASIDKLSYVEMTEIQAQAIPPILNGMDVAGLAQTGTGKTAAFVIPLMHRILKSKQQKVVDVPATVAASENAEVQASEVKASEVNALETPISETVSAQDQPATFAAPKESIDYFRNWQKNNYILILVPTRELAEQVQEAIASLAGDSGLKGFAIYGGMSYDRQKEALLSGLDFVVATPGRLIDLYKEHIIDLKQVRAVVFDEADRMFDMGFKDDMKYILQRIPRERQFLVFSATLNFDVLNTAYQFGADPVEVNISRDQAKAENVQDEIFHVGNNEKAQQLLSLLKHTQPKQAIIFSNFKHNVERIAQFLISNDVPAIAISSLLTQAQRNRVLEQFKAENEHNVLVATDVAARGLDIKGVDLVVNYELPNDSESYVHRIGRTGRAGTTGRAVSLVSDKDVESLERIESYLKHKVTIGYIEDSNLIKEFKPFPSEYGGATRYQGERSGGSSGDRFEGRGGSGRRGPSGSGSGDGRYSRKPFPRREESAAGSGTSAGQGRAPDARRRPGSGSDQRPAASSAAANQTGSGARSDSRRDFRRGPSDNRNQGRPGSAQPSGASAGRSQTTSPRFNKDTGARPHRKPVQHESHRGEKKSAAPATGAGIGSKVVGLFKRLFKF